MATIVEDVDDADRETHAALMAVRNSSQSEALRGDLASAQELRNAVLRAQAVLAEEMKLLRKVGQVLNETKEAVEEAVFQRGQRSREPTTLRLGSAVREIPMYECPLCNVRFDSTEAVHRHAESYEHRQREEAESALTGRDYASPPSVHCAHPVVDWNKAVCMACGAPVNLAGHPWPRSAPSPTPTLTMIPCPACNTGPISLKRGPRDPNCRRCGGLGMERASAQQDARFKAPPPPSDQDARREEWRRKHGLE
jgi:hypothetical protein